MNKRLYLCLAVCAVGSLCSAQTTASPANPITQSEKGLYSFIAGAAVGAAAKMPEENYSFKPTPDVRSFGQLVGHVADANYMFCAQASGEANPSKNKWSSLIMVVVVAIIMALDRDKLVAAESIHDAGEI